LRDGDVAVTEVSGYCNNYCAALCRTGIVGQQPEIESLYTVARESVDAALAALRPGALAGDVDRAARAVVDRAGKAHTFRHRAGYANGIQANGRLNISLKPDATDVIEEGMTFHLPIILFEKGKFSVACSETAVVTPGGGRPLARIGRDLIRA
jgi:Xaa-Pro dipeptidase